MADRRCEKHANGRNSPLQEQIGDEAIDTQSVASTASELQMSLLESKLENEMTKMAGMVKDTVSSLHNSVSSLTKQFEQKFSEIEQKLSSLATDRVILANNNPNRSISLFDQAYQSASNFETMTSSQNKGDNTHSLFAHSNQSCASANRNNARNMESLDLSKGDNLPSLITQSNQSCLSSHTNQARNSQSAEQSKGDNNHFKMKPQTFNGIDFDEFISQYEITCEINGWQYKEKSLYLANCLTGEARSLLNELDYEGKRDYNILVEKLRNRFGSVNKSEIYRTQLKSRIRNKGETIPELAQAIKKMVRQAYPGVNKEVIETLSLDIFIDAITDSDIRLRLRDAGPKTLAEAEQIAARIEAYKIADKQRSRLVGRVDFDCDKNKDENVKSPSQVETLSEAISTLTNEVKNIKQNNNNQKNGSFYNQKQGTMHQHNYQNYNKNPRFQRPYRNNQNRRYDHGSTGFVSWNRGNNPYQANQRNDPRQQDRTVQNFDNRSYLHRNETISNNSNGANQASAFGHDSRAQENLNLSAWGATTRHH